MTDEATLYGYWRSTASYRVRIAANMKGISLSNIPIHLRHGEQSSADHLARNPAGLVPVWQEGAFTLTQSLAIVEYLEETHPLPPLLPGDAQQRAVIREIAQIINADIHPIGNLRVLAKLTRDFNADDAVRAAWNRHWIDIGFTAIEARLATTAGRFAVGDQPTLADVCLVPQVYNARRFGLDVSAYPLINRVDEAARTLAAFAAAAPDRQPDAE